MHLISLISIKFIFVFFPKSGVSHILCVTFIYLIQYKLILLQTLNCHIFICIMIASGSQSDFSECHSNRHISFQDKTTARIFQLKLYVLNSMQIFYFQCLLRSKIINLYRTANINTVCLFNSYLDVDRHCISEHRVTTQRQQQLQHCDGGGAAAISPHSATCDRNKKHYIQTLAITHIAIRVFLAINKMFQQSSRVVLKYI